MKTLAITTLSLLLLTGAAYAETQSADAVTTTVITTETPAGEVTTDVTTTVTPPAAVPAPVPVPEPKKPTAYDAITREPVADPNARRAPKQESLRDQVRGRIGDEARGGR